jgi:ribosomal protein L5
MSSHIKNYQKYNKISRTFLYKNIHQTSTTIEKLTLFYTIEKNVSLKILIKLTSLLELMTGHRAYFIRSNKSSVHNKVRKGSPIGVKVTLRKKYLKLFLFIFIWETLPIIKNYLLKTKFNKIKQKKITSLMFSISDPLVFFDLKNFYFYFKSCLNLRILLSFSKNLTKQETLFFSCFNSLPC